MMFSVKLFCHPQSKAPLIPDFSASCLGYLVYRKVILIFL